MAWKLWLRPGSATKSCGRMRRSRDPGRAKSFRSLFICGTNCKSVLHPGDTNKSDRSSTYPTGACGPGYFTHWPIDLALKPKTSPLCPNILPSPKMGWGKSFWMISKTLPALMFFDLIWLSHLFDKSWLNAYYHQALCWMPSCPIQKAENHSACSAWFIHPDELIDRKVL